MFLFVHWCILLCLLSSPLIWSWSPEISLLKSSSCRSQIFDIQFKVMCLLLFYYLITAMTPCTLISSHSHNICIEGPRKAKNHTSRSANRVWFTHSCHMANVRLNISSEIHLTFKLLPLCCFTSMYLSSTVSRLWLECDISLCLYGRYVSLTKSFTYF